MLVGIKTTTHDSTGYVRGGPGVEVDAQPRFFLFEHAKFRNSKCSPIFENLGAQVIPELQRATGSRLLASGINSNGVWAVWNVPGVLALWRAMQFAVQRGEYANMQELIEEESQDLCLVHREVGNVNHRPSGYRYVLFEERTDVLAVEDELVKLEGLGLPNQFDPSWSLILRSMTGGLYRFGAIWRCVTDKQAVRVVGLDKPVPVWRPGAYEGSHAR